MSARSISTLSITVTANTHEAIAALRRLEGGVANSGRNIDKSSALIGGALGGLFGGKAGGAGGFVGGLLGGPMGAAAGAGIGTVIDSTLGGIASAISFGSSAVYDAVKEMIRVGAEYEMALAVFSVAAGSDEGGKKILKGMQNLAAGTNFSSEQLNKQSIILRGYGVEANQLVPTMTKLALIAQQTGRGEEGLGRLALAFSQARQAGRLFGTELRQFTEAGVGVKDFAQTMGVSAAAFRDLMEEGQVGFDVVVKTINRMGSEAAIAADKMNKTLTGRINSVRDLSLQAFGEIGLDIIDAFQVGPALGQLALFLQTLPEKVKELRPVLEKAKILLEPILSGLHAAVMVVFEAGKAFASEFVPNFKESRKIASDIGMALARGVGQAIDLALVLGKTLLTALKPLAMLADQVNSLLTGSKSRKFTRLFDAAGRGIDKAQAAGGPGGWAEKALDIFSKGFPKMGEYKSNLDQSGITVPEPGIPKAVADLAASINKNFAGGKGGSKYQEFMASMGTLAQAEKLGAVTNRAAADQFIAAQFKELTGSMSRIENTLPRAIEANTIEGQQQIEKVISNMQGQQQDVPAILKRIADTAEKQFQQDKQTAAEIRKIVMPRVMSN